MRIHQEGKGDPVTKLIDELTITDDFMFGAVMRDPEKCKPLLEMILGVKINRIEYLEPQKSIAERYESKSIRLDVYVADDVGTVYDVEIQTESKKSLPKRTRYYQGMIDLHILEKGEDYASLKKSFVIFICTFDPFGKGRRVYTFENRCVEDTSIALGDEATKIILNAKGTVGEVSEELRSVLSYMDGSAPDSEYTQALDKAVEEIRTDEKWRREYMVLNEMLIESRRIGEHRRSVAQIRKFRGRFSADELAEICFISPEALKTVLDAIDTHPDWDDEQVAENVDFE